MSLPFGLDFKSLVVGLLIAMFIVPYVRTMLASRSGDNKAVA